METRVIFRTHYQVDEPAYVVHLVRSCTSAVQSAYDETVARGLSRVVRSIGKDFNVAAAGYALDLGRSLGVINERNVWTERGQLVHLLTQERKGAWADGLDLDQFERLMFFKLFLEADGAVLLFLAKRLAAEGRLPDGESDWNVVARTLFLDVLGDYLQLGGTPADRLRLRAEVQRIKARGYSGKSGAHKLFLHLQTMHRLGLVGRVEKGNARIYTLREGDRNAIEALVDAVPNCYALEQRVLTHEWVDVAARVFYPSYRPEAAPKESILLRLLVSIYSKVMATGVSICPLSTVVEAIQIQQMANESRWVRYVEIVDGLRHIQHQHAADVRFHVDRRGEVAFVKLSDQMLAEEGLSNGGALR